MKENKQKVSVTGTIKALKPDQIPKCAICHRFGKMVRKVVKYLLECDPVLLELRAGDKVAYLPW